MNEVEFLKFVVENLVVNPQDIEIERKEDDLWVLLTLKVNKEDMGRVIWKEWNIVNSIRTLLKVVWLKLSKRITLKIMD